MDNFNERRTVKDRRKFHYTAYLPERRSGKDRRTAVIRQYKKKVA